MGKKGISAIVATVLVILITVAAVSIIWVGILPMISDSLEFSALDGRVSVVSGGGYTLYDAAREVAMVQVKREVDEGVMDRIVVSFLIDGNSVSSNVVAPSSGGTKTYAFDLSGLGVPESVEVAPIFSSGSKEKVGGITSSVDISSGVISGNAVGAYEMGRDYFYDMPTTGLVSWWKFNGDFEDSIGGNHGSQAGEANINGNVLILDGNDYLEINDVPFDFSTESFSIGGWIKLDTLNDYARLITKDDAYYLSADFNTDTFTFVAHGGVSLYSTTIVELGAWYYVVGTYEDSSNTMKLYVDGVLEDTDTQVAFLTSDYNLIIGAHLDGVGQTVVSGTRGGIDEVVVFGRTLTDEEVVALYENQMKE